MTPTDDSQIPTGQAAKHAFLLSGGTLSKDEADDLRKRTVKIRNSWRVPCEDEPCKPTEIDPLP